MTTKKISNTAVLGVHVTSRLVEAVLVRAADDGFHVVGRFMRQRVQQHEMASVAELATSLPGMRGAEESDYSIHIGDGSGKNGSSQIALSDLRVSGKKARGHKSHGAEGSPVTRATSIAPQLRDILGECASLGYPEPEIAFSIAPPDVSYIEVSIGGSEKDAKKPASSLMKEKKQSQHERLCQAVAEQHPTPFDWKRTTFLPLATVQGRQRHLALVPEATDPVGPTIEALTNQRNAPTPNARLVDAEVSAYIGLTRKVFSKESQKETICFVRVGSEDTVIVFFKDGQLFHFERLRSLTTYDSTETVCSRITLQQDEQKVGEVQHLLVHSEGSVERLVASLRKFYPDAELKTAHDALAGYKVIAPAEADGNTRLNVPAVSVALRHLENWNKDAGITAVNLLPPEIAERRTAAKAFEWHTGVMILVIFAFAAFYYWQHQVGEEIIHEKRQEMLMNPVASPLEDPAVVQFRLDSLTAAYNRQTHALGVIDSLLVGSERWSRFLDNTAKATAGISGIWFESWSPEGNNARLTGTGVSRARVAELARRLKGNIQKVESIEIEDKDKRVTVYRYSMTVPVPRERPPAAQYLQDVAAGRVIEGDRRGLGELPADYDPTPLSRVPVNSESSN